MDALRRAMNDALSTGAAVRLTEAETANWSRRLADQIAPKIDAIRANNRIRVCGTLDAARNQQ